MLAEMRFIKTKVRIVFIKFRLISPRLYNIDMFMHADVADIKKYPRISEYVPRYRGRKKMLIIKRADEIT